MEYRSFWHIRKNEYNKLDAEEFKNIRNNLNPKDLLVKIYETSGTGEDKYMIETIYNEGNVGRGQELQARTYFMREFEVLIRLIKDNKFTSDVFLHKM